MADFKQIAALVNLTTQEVLGETAAPMLEDLSNVVDFGITLQNSDVENKFLTNFVDRIGRVVMYDRVYKSSTNLGIYKDNLEYGTMLQRMMIDELPEAEDNETYELQDGASIDPFVVKLPKASAKYYDKRNTWEIDMTILDRQYRSAFTSASSLAAFVGMVFNAVENSRTLKIETLQKAILRTAMATTLKNDIPEGDYSAKSTIKAVNLLKLYNDEANAGTDLTLAEALISKDFLKFASKTINEYVRAMKDMSVLYNIEEAARFTPADKMHLTILGKFADAAQYYLEADTWHNTLVSLPGYGTVDNWQATGKDRSFANLSKINVKNADGDTVEAGGIVGVIYDADGMGVTCENYRVLSQRNEKGEYTNYFWKADFASTCYKDMNLVVFFMA